MQLPRLSVPTLAMAGTDSRFPVRRIFCVGQNYADHAREMGSDSHRSDPFFFMKPADAVVATGSSLPFPPQTDDLHHEVELVVALGAGGSDVRAEDALALIYGWAVGLDLTRRDLQAKAKAAGRPWDLAKGFDRSAPVGPLVAGLPPTNATLSLHVGDQLRQEGNVANMLWSIPEILAVLSRFVELAAGDLVFTGTPAGVGPIRRGERVTGSIVGAEPITVTF